MNIDELLTRGVAEIINKDNLQKQLATGKPLRIKLGIDPTSPNIHLGRAVVLLKMRDLQELGHTMVLIVGDFTGIIGDTSDKDAERPMLSEEIVRENMKNYIRQAGKILDLDKTEIHYNSEWLSKLGYNEIGEQADQFSVADFIARENIKKRLDNGKRVSLREVLYPLMQGYDSVAVRADLELGGTDQRFNLLSGRTLQTHYNQSPQDILMVNLIPGTDGRKMSSSWGNTIDLDDSADNMFGKIMSIPDDIIVTYFIHCTRVPMAEIENYEKQLQGDEINPRDIKLKLARAITEIYHGGKSATEAEEKFVSVFSKKEMPQDLPEVEIPYGKINLTELLLKTGAARSNSEARRLIGQGAVKIDGEKNTDLRAEIEIKSGLIVQAGKLRYYKVK